MVVAHNEAAKIRGRLHNLLSLDYPAGHLEIRLLTPILHVAAFGANLLLVGSALYR